MGDGEVVDFAICCTDDESYELIAMLVACVKTAKSNAARGKSA